MSDVELTEAEREAMDRASSVLGWQHLARYSGMSTEWLNVTLLAIVRSILAARLSQERGQRDQAWREALGDLGVEVDEDCPHAADQHAEGTCQMCDYAFAAVASIHRLAEDGPR